MATSTSDAFISWDVTGSTSIGTTPVTFDKTTGYFTTSIVPAPTTEFISMSMTLDDKWMGTIVEDEPEPVKPVKPIKRYSRKEFKEKLKELCG